MTQKGVIAEYSFDFYLKDTVAKAKCPFCGKVNKVIAYTLEEHQVCKHYKWTSIAGGIKAGMTFEGTPSELKGRV